MSFDQSFVAQPAADYLHGLLEPPYAVMRRIEDEARREQRPAVGRSTGALLRALAATARAERVLEVGTNLGYSALWLAAGLTPRGQLDTIEIDPTLARRAEAAFREAGIHDRARVHVGAALDLLPGLDGPYDLVFLDAVKAEYPAYLAHALRTLRAGGLVCADNAFWLGQAWDAAADDADTRGIREYTRRVLDDERLVTTLVPSEDGLLVSVRRA